MSRRIFPIRPAAFTPEFKNFLARGFYNIICPLAAFLLFGWAKHMPEVLQGATYSTAGILSLVSIYLWAGTLRNFFRFHQFLYRLFKNNPFHDETTTRMLAVGVNQEQIYWNEEAEFHNEKELYFRHWRTVGEIVKAIVLFLPRLIMWLFDKTKPPNSDHGDSSMVADGLAEPPTSFSQRETSETNQSVDDVEAEEEPSSDDQEDNADLNSKQNTGIYSVAC